MENPSEKRPSNLQSMDVEDDEAGRPAPGDGNVGEVAGEGERSGDVAFLLNPLRRPSGEERKDEGEGGDEQPGQCVDDGHLLEYHTGRAKRRQEGDMLASNPLGVGDEQVGESIGEGPNHGKRAIFRSGKQQRHDLFGRN